MSMMFLLLACNTLTEPIDSGTNGDTESTAPTWYADIHPILQQNCTRCHSSGGLGTGDFTDYTITAAMAEIMLARIDAGTMPPPASDPECHDYHGSATLTISDADRDTLASWIDAGKPKGDPSTAVEVAPVDETLSDVDFELRLTEPYTPTFPQDGNEYRCFIVDGVPEDDYYITAMHAVVDQPSMVHHMEMHGVNPDALSAPYLGPAGFDCYSGEYAAFSTGALSAWGPGMMPLELPDGVGMLMTGASPILLVVHYYDTGDLDEGITDRSGWAFRTTNVVETTVAPMTWGTMDFMIPADVESYSVTTSAQVADGWDLTLYTLWPHMHVLGDGYEVTSTDINGVEDCVLWADAYSFENQYYYAFDEPFVATSGSMMSFTCTWNNSTSNPDLLNNPPVPTTYGLNTDEEMCWFYGLYSYEPSQPSLDVQSVDAGAVSLLQSVDDLDLSGNFTRANSFGGPAVNIEGVPFTIANNPGNAYAGINVPDLDSDALTWSGLESLVYNGIYEYSEASLLIDTPVAQGQDYRLQLVFFEPYYSRQGLRRLNLLVEGELVVKQLDVHTTVNTAGIVYTLDLTATDNSLNIEIQSADSGDGTTLISGMTLEALP